MNRSTSQRGAMALGVAGLLLTTALGACNNKGGPGNDPSDAASSDLGAATAALPMSTTTPAAINSAPPVTALPASAAMRVRQLPDPREAYGYLDRAYYQESAVEDGPPDYTFDDNGVRPWTWTTDNGSRVISEPVAGGYRTYYYQPGADAPYLVRDPAYSYAYDNGALVGVFTLAGVSIALGSGAEQADYGARYFDRGSALYRDCAMRPHLPVNAYAWNDRRGDLAAQRMAWHQQAANNPQWSAWDNAHRDEEQRRWGDDRAQHEAAARQFGDWQQQRFQGQPPQFYGQPAAGYDRSTNHHTGAVVAGVIAAGAAAVAAHAIFANHGDHGRPANAGQGYSPTHDGGHGQDQPQFQNRPGAPYGQQSGQQSWMHQGAPNGQHGPQHAMPQAGFHNGGQDNRPAGNPAMQNRAPVVNHGVPAGYHPNANGNVAAQHAASVHPNPPPHLMAPHNNQPAPANAPPPHSAPPQMQHQEAAGGGQGHGPHSGH